MYTHVFLFWHTRWGRALFDIKTNDFLFLSLFSGGGTRGLVGGRDGSSGVGLGTPPLSSWPAATTSCIYFNNMAQNPFSKHTHKQAEVAARYTSISTSVCVCRAIQSDQTHVNKPSKPDRPNNKEDTKSTHDIILYTHAKQHARQASKPNRTNLDKFTRKRDPAGYP